jgi:transposase
MSGVYKLEIGESDTELKELMNAQKKVAEREKIQLLYLLKSKQAPTVKSAASLIGKNRATVQKWLAKYRKGGIKQLLEKKVKTGRPRALQVGLEKALAKRLEQSEGFNSYGEIGEWIENNLGRKLKYKTVHKIVYYRLKAAPKVARPKSSKQSEQQRADFKKN